MSVEPLISVIVPIYNVEKYLDRCIESIVNQTYKNLEIILVDDGSTDSSSAKCDEWAEKDNRIIVIHKANGGQAEARNYGIETATGDYIGFVDSDDIISNNMYFEMADIATNTGADMVACNHISFDENNLPDFKNPGRNPELLEFNKEDAVKDIILEAHLRSTVWNLLVKTEIAKTVMFDVGKIHEDILWPFRAILKCKKIVYTSNQFYGYFQRAGSTMNNGFSEKRFDALDALEVRAKLVNDCFPDIYGLAEKAYMDACMYQYQYLSRQKKSKEFNEFKRILHKRFCSGDMDTLYHYASIKYKLWYTMFRIMPNFTCILRNALKAGL